MKRNIILIALISVFLFSCKTKEKIIYQTVKEIDSTENVHLKQTVSQLEKDLYTAESRAKTAEEKFTEAVEKLNVSEKEKQTLKETFETWTKEYNENGILIKETYSKRISELITDLEKSKEQLKEKTEQIKSQTETIDFLTVLLNKKTSSNVELEKQVKYLEEENVSLRSVTKTKSKPQWLFLIIGFVAGLAVYYYFPLLLKLIFVRNKL